MFALGRGWWMFVVRGVLAVLLGVLALVMPQNALLTLVWLFGVFAVVEGGVNLAAAFRSRGRPGRQPWWELLLEGLFSVVAGVLAFIVPGVTAMVLLYIIGAWAVVTGVMEVMAALRLREHIRGEWLLALSGVLSIAFGVLLALFPAAGAVALVLWIGVYAVVFGLMLIAVGLRIRSWARSVERPLPRAPELVHGR